MYNFHTPIKGRFEQKCTPVSKLSKIIIIIIITSETQTVGENLKSW